VLLMVAVVVVGNLLLLLLGAIRSCSCTISRRRICAAVFAERRVFQLYRVQARDDVVVLDPFDTASAFHNGLPVRAVSEFNSLTHESTRFAGRMVLGDRQVQVVHRWLVELVVVHERSSHLEHNGWSDQRRQAMPPIGGLGLAGSISHIEWADVVFKLKGGALADCCDRAGGSDPVSVNTHLHSPKAAPLLGVEPITMSLVMAGGGVEVSPQRDLVRESVLIEVGRIHANHEVASVFTRRPESGVAAVLKQRDVDANNHLHGVVADKIVRCVPLAQQVKLLT